MEKAPPANLDWAKDVPCRNITIHGFCKYEGQGCSFNHDRGTSKPKADAPSTPTSATVGSINGALDDLEIDSRQTKSAGDKKKFNPAASSVFMPTGSAALPKPSANKFSALSPKLSNIPSFVPSVGQDGDHEQSSTNLKQFNVMESSTFQPTSATPFGGPSPTLQNPYLHHDTPVPPPQINPYTAPPESLNPYAGMGGSAGQDFMYPPHPQSAFPLQYHLYAPTPPPHLQIPLKGNQQNAETLFIPNKLREALLHKNEATLKTLGPSNLPNVVGVYYDLVPLDTALEKTTRSYNHTSSIYKAFSNTNGRAYALRRIEGVKISKDKSLSTIHQWIKLKNSNIGQVVDAFTSRSFGDNSLIVVYDYYPDSKTLYENHFRSNISKPEPITTEDLWTYMCQISAAIAAAHSKNLPVRSLSLQKVILTSKNRIRLSDCGVLDILNYESELTPDQTKDLMAQDITMFGKLIFQLASIRLPAEMRARPEIQLVQHLDQTDDFKTALNYLLDSTNAGRSIFEFQKLICTRLFKELDKEQLSADYYEAQLTREIENARLFRLVSKINFIIDRAEYEHNPMWQQSGSRYPVKLFHEFVFHQVDEKGKPVLDLSHVLRTLNKLDAGIDEKILLVSKDEQSCLIVSYKEIKDLIEKSFRDLTKD
ncbi:CYFA0S07e03708g1_1 [Cyberlindnera fabianii]|uniref:PAN2-PAN3 deadenylation complex subunit PAN3 n=1 Tax=Cyberlindnera fabianii TaxID=36022 RepID=A0A061AWK0_CYBFA|nr:CYFA0S07e03708g1_1 [Cyberlindnera fabianii]